MVRTTISLPAKLLEAADQAVKRGRAKNRNELLVLALRREIEAADRAAIDEQFRAMSQDQERQQEANQIVEEHVGASWAALQNSESL